jgi:hypothetical protein
MNVDSFESLLNEHRHFRITGESLDGGLYESKHIAGLCGFNASIVICNPYTPRNPYLSIHTARSGSTDSALTQMQQMLQNKTNYRG